ncbi:MAG: pilus assembly protein TadG, partial [Erythrobacter sp.]
TETTTSQEQTRTEYGCYRAGRRNHWVIRRTVTRTTSDIVYSIEDPVYTTTTTSSFSNWNHKAVDYDTSAFKTFASVNTPTGSNGTDEASTWEGCIEERDTVRQSTFSWNALLGLTPSNAYDLDIDSAPTSDDATKWKPLWSQVSYRRTNGSNDYSIVDVAESENGFATHGEWAACPSEAQLLTTMTEGEFDAYADGLQPGGATFHNIGMIWGARLASPEGIFATNVNAAPANGGDVARHIIFMSDGAMFPNERVYSSYGIEGHDKRVTEDGISERSARHTARFTTACAIAKSKGIRVWVIAFDTGLTPDLENCASDDSAFPASSAAQLNEAFQEIAKDVGELRITQ